MIEVGAAEVPDEDVLGAIEFGLRADQAHPRADRASSSRRSASPRSLGEPPPAPDEITAKVKKACEKD
jgi:polyribonucleotide nucleotidyltransferase